MCPDVHWPCGRELKHTVDASVWRLRFSKGLLEEGQPAAKERKIRAHLQPDTCHNPGRHLFSEAAPFSFAVFRLHRMHVLPAWCCRAVRVGVDTVAANIVQQCRA